MQLSVVYIAAVLGFAASVSAGNSGSKPKPVTRDVTWDCSRSPQACNNACFAVACQKKSWKLRYYGGDPEKHRQQSGAEIGPCKDDGLRKYGPAVKRETKDHTTADEYPFASAEDGGPKAILRCTTKKDSDEQGLMTADMWRNLRKGIDWISISLDKVDVKKSPFCKPYVPNPTVTDQSVCKNDGYEFTLVSQKQGKTNVYQQCPNKLKRRDLGLGLSMAARAAAQAAEHNSEVSRAVLA